MASSRQQCVMHMRVGIIIILSKHLHRNAHCTVTSRAWLCVHVANRNNDNTLEDKITKKWKNRRNC